jgi:hypothetical protein
MASRRKRPAVARAYLAPSARRRGVTNDLRSNRDPQQSIAAPVPTRVPKTTDGLGRCRRWLVREAATRRQPPSGTSRSWIGRIFPSCRSWPRAARRSGRRTRRRLGLASLRGSQTVLRILARKAIMSQAPLTEALEVATLIPDLPCSYVTWSALPTDSHGTPMPDRGYSCGADQAP